MSFSEDLKLFKKCCPELFLNGRDVEIFQSFKCPISIIEADVKEYVVDEYESAELIVLRLYEAGIRTIEGISALSGIDRTLVEKLLKTEIFSYGHINAVSGEVTDAGKRTLDENTDINNVIQHALYEVKRNLQVEALTGTIIRPEAERIAFNMQNYSDKFDPNIFPKGTVILDEDLLGEINRNLQYYVDHDYLSDGNTIESIGKIETREVKYRDAYYVQMQKFVYPFIAIPFFVNQKVKKQKIIEPTAISFSDFNRLQIDSIDFNYLVRDDSNFYYLQDYREDFEQYINGED
ncbi:MAG: hypothetical protein SPL03_11225 [Succinivibrio dextrinosolvens]|nr:hypothetical protein [Succinivibrio dextrinosolvens]